MTDRTPALALAAPPSLPLAFEGDDVDPTLLCALADARLGWELVLRAEPVDDVPHLVAALSGAAPVVTDLEVAQARTPFFAAQRREPRARRELAAWLSRFDHASAWRRTFQPRGPGALVTPLVGVAPGQVVGYRVRLWHGDALIGAVQGAFCVAGGHVTLW